MPAGRDGRGPGLLAPSGHASASKARAWWDEDSFFSVIRVLVGRRHMHGPTPSGPAANAAGSASSGPGDHVGAFQRAGIPLSHVINEGNHRPWKRPSDPDGQWERALADPASYVDYVVAIDSDSVAANVNKSDLDALLVLHVTGQPAATIYKTRKSNQAR